MGDEGARTSKVGCPVTSAQTLASDEYRRDLGNGLVLRWTTPEDVERVATLYAQVFRKNADAPLNWHDPIWTRDMFSGRHPNIGPRDFAVVEDTRSGTFVAATCLLRYTAVYEGLPFAFGNPEMVASLPDYRRQGLIRAIFELIHARSEERGDLVQGITGIPNYYRQFGYEYATTLPEGLTVYFPAIPPPKADAPESYSLREATLDDIPLQRRVWTRAAENTALWTDIPENFWRWAMTGMDPDSMERWRPYLIVDADGRKAGALVLAPVRLSGPVVVSGPWTDEGVPLVRVVPSVLRGVRALAETTRPGRPDTPTPGAITLRWNEAALRPALGDIPFTELPFPYAWYMRVPDLPRFLRSITPVLEQRLARSANAGYTGELTIDFYKGGLRLAFESGRLTAVEDWQRPVWGEGNAGYPPLVFLQALFGHRGLDELRAIYPDVYAEGEAVALLDTLFPKRPSLLVWLG